MLLSLRHSWLVTFTLKIPTDSPYDVRPCPDLPHTQIALMDRGRLDALGRRLQMLILEASVLLLINAQCGDAVLSLQGFVDKLRQSVAALLEGSHTR